MVPLWKRRNGIARCCIEGRGRWEFQKCQYRKRRKLLGPLHPWLLSCLKIVLTNQIGWPLGSTLGCCHLFLYFKRQIKCSRQFIQAFLPSLSLSQPLAASFCLKESETCLGNQTFLEGIWKWLGRILCLLPDSVHHLFTPLGEREKLPGAHTGSPCIPEMEKCVLVLWFPACLSPASTACE